MGGFWALNSTAIPRILLPLEFWVATGVTPRGCMGAAHPVSRPARGLTCIPKPPSPLRSQLRRHKISHISCVFKQTQEGKRALKGVLTPDVSSCTRRGENMATETVIVSTTCTGCSVQSQKVLRCRFPGQHGDAPASLDAENNTISCCVPSSVRPPSHMCACCV